MSDDPEPDIDALLEAARDAAENAYVPYSEYAVGAAIETANGSVYVGCNVENANFSNTLHAEGVAVAEAVADGHREFARLVVSAAARDGVTPCGRCRQTLAEFCAEDFPVYCDTGDGLREYALGELLPDTITPGTLGVEE
ncbi:cytidine deaminase [Halarchaeum grantii]|uniref:cytidine deaminase n=1 Tax=Halarchaeum grantii TaxID=1193105 RepID=A0A830ERH6_9EURY|nr:cytidine deaminase [Halarchaeum grantii]